MSENFEQKVKRLLDDVQLEPRASVWQDLKPAIRSRKTKRRFIFWWLLPVALTAGGLLYLLNNDETITAKDHSPVPSSGTVSTKTSPGNTIKEKDNIRIDKEITHGETTIEVTTALRSKRVSKTGGQGKSTVVRVVQEENTIRAADSDPSPDPKTTNEVAVITDPTVSQKEEQPKTNNMVKPENKPAPAAALPDTNITGPVANISDRRPGWRFGITTDIGATIATEGALFSNKKEMFTSFASPSGPTSGVSATINKRTTSSARFSAGLFLTANRSISKLVSFQSSLGFRYHSFSVTSSLIKDSIVSGNAYPFPVSRTASEYKSGFIDLYTGISLKVLQVNDLKLGLGVGVDNQFLVAAKHTEQNTLLSNNTSSQQKDLSLASYNKWQPMFRFQLVAAFNEHQRKWLQLSPYVNYGLRPFEKVATSKERLTSFGLSATYFFK